MKTSTLARAIPRLAVLLCSLAVVSHSALAQQGVRFRLVREVGIVVSATVNGTGPFDFILDTGTTTTLMDASLARKLSLPAIERTLLHTVAGTQALVRSSIATLTISPASAKNLEVLVTDLRQLKEVDPRIVGIVGQNFLLEHNYLIDYQRRLLSFEVTDEIRRRVSGERIRILDGPVAHRVLQEQRGKNERREAPPWGQARRSGLQTGRG